MRGDARSLFSRGTGLSPVIKYFLHAFQIWNREISMQSQETTSGEMGQEHNHRVYMQITGQKRNTEKKCPRIALQR